MNDLQTTSQPLPSYTTIQDSLQVSLERWLDCKIVVTGFAGMAGKYAPLGYKISAPALPGPGMMEKSLSLLRRAMEPAPPESCEKLAAALYVMTVQRSEDAISLDLAIDIYARGLAGYPLDVAREVCEGWPQSEHGKWWPSWHELFELLEERVLMRRDLLAQLERLETRPDLKVVG